MRLRPDMNLLMIAAILGAIVIDEYFEAATVAFLFALSLALESWQVPPTKSASARTNRKLHLDGAAISAATNPVFCSSFLAGVVSRSNATDRA